jgi:hypothetical protein
MSKLRIVDRVEYLKTVAKTNMAARQVEYQCRLYDIFINLTIAPVRVSSESPQAADTGSRDAEDAIGKNQWEEVMNKAFGKAIELKLDLEKSSRKYEFEFPKLGDGFDRDWMTPAHTIQDAVPQGSRVSVCLRPAVFSVSRDRIGEDRVLVVWALVMVEGFGSCTCCLGVSHGRGLWSGLDTFLTNEGTVRRIKAIET